MLVDGLNDRVGIVAGIDADCPLGLLASHHASMLLEGGGCDLFDDHLLMVSGQ
jgi:hypothetical protein